VGEGFEALEGKRKVHAPLVVGDGVNFVDDHGFDIAQDGAALFGSEQDVERFGRGHQNVRRTPEHQAAVFHQRIAGADGGADLGHEQAAVAGHLENFSEGDFEILLDVVAESFERGDVEDFGAVVEFSGEGLADQAIDAGEEGG